MAVFEFPVPYTATLEFNDKPRKYNVLGSLRTELEELSMQDLTPVASWQAANIGDTRHLGPAGECYWHNGRFLSPILVAPHADTEPSFLPLRPIDVRRTMLTRDRVFTYDDILFRNSQPHGYDHDLFQETFANDSWRPDNLPNGDYVEDTFAMKAKLARELLHSLVLVAGNLFQIKSEPVLGCIYNSELEAVLIHIRSADFFHEDWELFRLDRLEDAVTYAEERWSSKRFQFVGGKPTIHDASHLSFDDEAYSLINSARTAIDETLLALPNLPKEVGMSIVRLNHIVPRFEEGRPDLPDTNTLEDIAAKLPGIKTALKPHDKARLDAAVERWNLRPNLPTFALR